MIRGLFVLLLLGWTNAEGQEYPAWFLLQGRVGCRTIAVGYAEHSSLKDSTASYALQNAAVNAAAFTHIVVKAEQTFWGTEAGTYRINSSTLEVLEEGELQRANHVLRRIDVAENNGCMMILAGDSTCIIPDGKRQKVNLSQVSPPHWTEEVPKEPGFVSAVGLAPRYYYESSSWKEAEWMARRNLARSLHSRIKGVQKSAVEGQSLELLSSDVVLKNAEVVERWLDIHQEIFYVLVRTQVN